MTWWEIALTVWVFGSIPLSMLIGKAIASADVHQTDLHRPQQIDASGTDRQLMGLRLTR